MVEPQPSKLVVRVRFPSPAPSPFPFACQPLRPGVRPARLPRRTATAAIAIHPVAPPGPRPALRTAHGTCVLLGRSVAPRLLPLPAGQFNGRRVGIRRVRRLRRRHLAGRRRRMRMRRHRRMRLRCGFNRVHEQQNARSADSKRRFPPQTDNQALQFLETDLFSFLQGTQSPAPHSFERAAFPALARSGSDRAAPCICPQSRCVRSGSYRARPFESKGRCRRDESLLQIQNNQF